MRALLYPVMALAGIGFALSLAVHLVAWAGFAPPSVAMGLHFGIFVVWLPAALVAQRLSRDYKQRDWWKATFRGAPPWLRRAGNWLLGYALLNFGVFMFVLPKDGPSGEINMFRGFSGHWMAFYGTAVAIIYSALHAEAADQDRRCSSGHLVSAVARYCEQCGALAKEIGRQG